MKESTQYIVIYIILIFIAVFQTVRLEMKNDEINELNKYKILVEDIDKEPYVTDNYRLVEGKCYEIHFNYDLDNIKGWELYIDDDYSSDEIKAICNNIIGK